jgi:hypothetical protein
VSCLGSGPILIGYTSCLVGNEPGKSVLYVRRATLNHNGQAGDLSFSHSLSIGENITRQSTGGAGMHRWLARSGESKGMASPGALNNVVTVAMPSGNLQSSGLAVSLTHTTHLTSRVYRVFIALLLGRGLVAMPLEARWGHRYPKHGSNHPQFETVMAASLSV